MEPCVPIDGTFSFCNIKVILTFLDNNEIGDVVPEDDIFRSDSLPKYAKSYILPRMMKKDMVDARLKMSESDTQDHENGGLVLEDKTLEAFKFSMLKASLDYESGFVGPTQGKKILFHQ